jgi:hypothetical protein
MSKEKVPIYKEKVPISKEKVPISKEKVPIYKEKVPFLRKCQFPKVEKFYSLATTHWTETENKHSFMF